jgi:hypothetical protein
MPVLTPYYAVGVELESLLCQCLLKGQTFYRAGVIAPAPLLQSTVLILSPEIDGEAV